MNYVELARRSLRALRSCPGQDPSHEQRNRAAIAADYEVVQMSLDEFSRAGLILRVHSAALGAVVLFVSDNVPDADLHGSRFTVYRASELRKLAQFRPGPRSLQTLHDVKTIFQGALTDARPPRNAHDPHRPS